MKAVVVWKWIACVTAGGLGIVLAALVSGRPVQAKPDKGTCDELKVTADADEAFCASGAIQCNDEGSGHSHQAATSANHNPVTIVALVTRNGVAVAGLTAANFFLSSNAGPAGGPSLLLCPAGGTGCGGGAENMFKASSDGVYSLFAHPGPAGTNWRAGAYFPTLQVVLPDGREERVLVRVDIPAGP